MKTKEKVLVKPSCPKCGSGQVLYRITKKKSICRVCGNEWSKDDKKAS